MGRTVTKYLLWLPVSVLSLTFAFPAFASDIKVNQVTSNIPNLSELKLPSTNAQVLTQQPAPTTDIVPETKPTDADDADIFIDVTGEKDTLPESTPTYVIEKEEIQKQGAKSAAEVLRGLPGFAINNVGFGADIHTGTYYRGQSINQSVFLLNGRPLGTNVNLYHGGTDLNSIPVESIERVELYSGTSSTLYGSEAFGGVVNIITKQGDSTPKLNAGVEFGSYGESNYRASYGGASGPVKFNLSIDKYNADNNYPVPKDSVNRGADGRFFNGDTATTNYSGSVTYDLNPNNSVSLDAYKISSRRGLTYFGFFPALQRDRLDHDVLNVGLSWKSLLGGNKDSVLNTTIGYNQDYFNTYGPSGNTIYRQGTLNSEALTARVEHQWQFDNNNLLRWGFDAKNNYLEGDVLSNDPRRIAFNGSQNRERFDGAIFALDTWNITKEIQADLGLRQNFTSDFGNYLNPSVGLKYSASQYIAVRGSWASVQRNPGLDQLYVYDTVHGWAPNPDLKPETGSSWTAGFDVNLSQNLTGQFTYFGSSLDNRLSTVAGKWANIGLVNTNGLEAALRWQVSRDWSTFLNYTYTDARIESGGEKGLQLSTVPFSVAQMGIGYAANGWELNLIGSYNGGSRRALISSTGSSLDFSPSWFNLDLGAKIPISKNVGLTFFLENLADVSYEKVNRIYQPGLTYRIGISSTF
jgi:vitamin B12 transporter